MDEATRCLVPPPVEPMRVCAYEIHVLAGHRLLRACQTRVYLAAWPIAAKTLSLHIIGDVAFAVHKFHLDLLLLCLAFVAVFKRRRVVHPPKAGDDDVVGLVELIAPSE